LGLLLALALGSEFFQQPLTAPTRQNKAGVMQGKVGPLEQKASKMSQLITLV
jgi:hypothetical protein